MSLLNTFRILFYSSTIALLIYLLIPLNYINPELKAIGDLALFNFNDDRCIRKVEDFSIKMHFSPLPGDTVGLCLRIPGGNRVILVDKSTWENDLTDDEKFFVVVHEMGHCFLDLNHRPDITNYMYYRVTPLESGEVYKQFQEDLNVYCSKKP